MSRALKGQEVQDLLKNGHIYFIELIHSRCAIDDEDLP